MIPFLLGEQVFLRPLEQADADGDYPFWFNDAEVCAANSHAVYPYRIEQAQAYIANANANPQQQLVLAICVRGSGLHIGNAALQSINWVYRSAEFAIVIGNKEYWGGGYGTEAARLIIEHGFSALNLLRVYCGTFENNTGMQHLADKLGMTAEGIRRSAVWKDGRYLDVLEYGVLRHEWHAAIP